MLRIFNSLTKTVETFEPIQRNSVGMYACGPTVYDFPHIGHGRKYVNDDVLRRTLENLEDFKVTHVQNITDVGHLVSDSDDGEDKLEKGARKYGKTVWEVAEEYTKYFLEEMDSLNILRPNVQCKATDHITEQIELIQKILDNGYGYETEEAVYFDVTRFDHYGELFGQSLEEKMVGVRSEVETETLKKHPADFALWFKRVGKFADHVMHWESPWGDGFPGWHIECSAMSMKYLGEQIDVHTGGEDHLSIHHPNEIAQSEAATGKHPFVKYWFHSVFLMVDGKKMSKSLGNVYRVADIVEKGYSAMALRYYYLTTHYRKTLNFTWEGLKAAEIAYEKLKKVYMEVSTVENKNVDKENEYYKDFVKALENDLNTPEALAVVWGLARSNESDLNKKSMLSFFDLVLGLNLSMDIKEQTIPEEVKEMLKKRVELRQEKRWAEADAIRDKIIAMGFEVKDR